MNLKLSPTQIGHIVASPAVNGEFSNKIKELDRRLQRNGLSYKQWDLMNDRQRSIFSDDMFLDPECADNMNNYVNNAVNSCGCADVVEDLHHHSPALMKEIIGHHNRNPQVAVKVDTNENLANYIDDIWSELESEDS
tara:strand:- start:104 stop:514 length:411 start_codon:yes stop_codon:yes gene_type:complete